MAKGRIPRQKNHWSSRLGVFVGLITQQCKNQVITETQDAIARQGRRNPVPDCNNNVLDRMTLVDQSPREIYQSTSICTPKESMYIGCWNIRTMYTAGKTAQVDMEMERYKIDILGLSEVRWPSSGRTRLQSGKVVLHSGRADGSHLEGVALMLSAKATNALIKWEPINERIILARFFSKYIKTTVILVYAPTNEASEETKTVYMEQLQAVIETVPKHDMLLVIGDFNAKVGADNAGYERVMGREGTGVMNDNGERLVNLCEVNRLIVTGTLFPHKLKHKLTWTSPNGKSENQIDHILVSKQHRTSVLDTRAMRGADVGTDHELVRCKIRIKLKRNKQIKEDKRKKFDTTKLYKSEERKAFCLELKNRFETLEIKEETTGESEVEMTWKHLEETFNSVAEEKLGFKKKGQKPWISKESWKLVEERKETKRKIENCRSDRVKIRLRAQYSEKDREVKSNMRKDRRKWTDNMIEEAEKAANNGRMKTVYEITRTLSNEKRRTPSVIKDKEGKILSNEEDCKKRWKEHFEEVLNRPVPTNPIENLDEKEILENIETGPITREEITRALKSLKSGKSGGKDGITAELLKADPVTTVNYLERMFKAVWEHEKVPADWNKGLIVKIPKKGDKTVCDNYRGITLLSVPSKILGKVLIGRIREGVDGLLREEQAGFRRGRSTTEQLFTLRNIIEQCAEWNSPLYINFTDFEKAFDSVHRESIWKIMKSYGIPDKLIRMVKLLYEKTECSVLENGEESEWFEVRTGVKQGCVMSGFLFLITIDWIMKSTTSGTPAGIRWNFTSKLEDLDFADDIALLSSKYRDLQSKTSSLKSNAERVGLKINANKTKVMRLNTKVKEHIMLGEEALEEVDSFTYLGGIVTKKGGCDEDIRSRLSKARAQFNRLRKIWNSSVFSIKTKVRLFNTLVISVLTYGCETWKMNEGDKKKLDTFQNTCLRKIMRIRWPRKITNKELHEKTRTTEMNKVITKRRWTWIGHILRMDKNRICTTALTWQPEGKRSVGRPKTTWRRTVESERCQLGWEGWGVAKTVAKEREKWKQCIGALCANGHEEDRIIIILTIFVSVKKSVKTTNHGNNYFGKKIHVKRQNWSF